MKQYQLLSNPKRYRVNFSARIGLPKRTNPYVFIETANGYSCRVNEGKFRTVIKAILFLYKSSSKCACGLKAENVVVDDGTESIRVAAFRNAALELCAISNEEFLKLQENIEEFEPIKKSVLGKIVIANGRVKNNQMFNRIEMVADNFNLNPDPAKEIEKLEKK